MSAEVTVTATPEAAVDSERGLLLLVLALVLSGVAGVFLMST